MFIQAFKRSLDHKVPCHHRQSREADYDEEDEQTWSYFDEPIVLDEDGVSGQVAMDYWGLTAVQVAGGGEGHLLLFLCRRDYNDGKDFDNLSAERIWVHHLFQAWNKNVDPWD